MKYKIVLLLIVSLLFTACNKVEVTPSPLVKVEKELPKTIEIKKTVPKQKQKETFVWESNSKIFFSQKEYDDVILAYVKSKYPEELKAYKLQQKKEIEKERKKLARSNTFVLGSLMWQDNSDAKSVQRNWQGAIDYCKNLSLVGYSDWRLGNKDELKKLYKYKHKLKYFSSNYYWSSTTYEGYKDYAWIVYFYNGFVGRNYKSTNDYVRCVRDGQ